MSCVNSVEGGSVLKRYSSPKFVKENGECVVRFSEQNLNFRTNYPVPKAMLSLA